MPDQTSQQQEYRGGVECVTFQSGDARLVGILYPAVGSGPRPTAILLHGVPGSEKNVDIAYRLRELGWHTLIVHFRGSWGSGGAYDMTKQPDDTVAAVDFLSNANQVWQVDPAKIAVVGYSLGSRAALVAAYRDPRIAAVVSISGVADFDELMLSHEAYEGIAPFVNGATPADMSKQWMKLGGSENPISIVSQLKQPILIIHGTEDEVVPYWMAPALYEAAKNQATGNPPTFCTVEGADHTFTRQRQQLVETVTAWLDEWAKTN